MKKLFALLLCLVVLFSVSANVFAEEEKELGPVLTDIKNTGKIVVGQFADHPPWFFTIVNDEGELVYEGFEKYMMDDIAQLIADYIGVESLEVEYMQTSVAGVLAAVQAGKAHFAFSLAPTTERRQAMDFTDYAYHRSLQVIAVLTENKDDEKFLPENKLKGCVITGTMGSSTVITLKEQYPECEVLELENASDCLISLLTGKCDGYVLNEKSAILYSAANPQMCIAEGLSYEIPVERDPGSCIAFLYGNDDLKQLLNDYIVRILEDGTFAGYEERSIAALDDPTLLEGYNMNVNLGGENTEVTKEE